MTIEGADDSWDFGSGAGFYVNATTPKWSKHYKMYDYITKELPAVVAGLFPVECRHQQEVHHGTLHGRPIRPWCYDLSPQEPRYQVALGSS